MADISLEAVTGKLNRVGYEAFIQALRQAKGAGNRNLELAHWLTHILQKERSDITLTADHFKLDRAKLLMDLGAAIAGLRAEPDRDAGDLRSRAGRARRRLVLRDAAVRRNADPHRPSSRRRVQEGRAAARADSACRASSARSTSTRSPTSTARSGAARRRKTCARWTARVCAAPARRAPRTRPARAARPRSTGSRRTSPRRRRPARWTRSSAATRKSARSSMC